MGWTRQRIRLPGRASDRHQNDHSNHELEFQHYCLQDVEVFKIDPRLGIPGAR
jgi:hypothetical protein